MCATIVFLLAFPLHAQFGNRLPGRRRPSSTSTTSTETGPLSKSVSITGAVVQIDDHSLMLEAADTRILNFKLTAQTQFEKITRANIKPGDRLRVDGTQDGEANLTASSIGPEGSAASSSTTAPAQSASAPGDDDPDRPRLKRAGAAAPSGDEPASTRPEIRRAPPAIVDNSREVEDTDPNRPKLRRGVPKQRESAPEPEEIAAGRPSLRIEEQGRQKMDTKMNDPLIQRAMDVAESFSEQLPNYVCQQFTTRYVRQGSAGWRALDVVSANVVYENNKESYRNIMINGKTAKKAMEDLPGAWSTGEFGTTLRSLLSARAAADFKFRKTATVAGLETKVYEYKVERLNSDWRVQLGSQAIIPGYSGRVWIDTKNARVLRIEMQADNVPEEFPLDQVEAANDYGFVRLGGTQEFLLPTHAENLSCERGTSICSRNSIDFRNYHKYSGDSTITFDK
ncbi:MAG: DUF5666 domain-containing protein [Acidobacteriota bacterium]|nr:DUF5666 domain-containing protein [Acidobacteriota bacterium]